MWKSFLAALFLATPLFAKPQETAYEAMRTMAHQLNREFVNHVISIAGTNGNPQPATWKILIEDQHARGGVREVEVTDGRISSERTPLRSSVEGSLGPVVDTNKLNLDSSGAFTLAQQTATNSHVSFASADYNLHVDEHGSPIWEVGLRRENGEPAGRIFIGANHGTITRTEGLFVGGDQVAVQQGADEPEREEANDDEDGDTNQVKMHIKEAWRQMRADVHKTFYKVRRSFVDFFRDH
jgi:hypothetical protein